MALTLTPDEVNNLARNIRSTRYLNFTSLENMRAVKKACKQYRIPVRSRTAHGSLLDPRYTVEGRNIPDRGLANNYNQMQPKLYVLEVDRF